MVAHIVLVEGSCTFVAPHLLQQKLNRVKHPVCAVMRNDGVLS